MGSILKFFMGLFSEKMDTSVKQPRWLLNNLWLWKSNHSAVKLSSVYCSACVCVCEYRKLVSVQASLSVCSLLSLIRGQYSDLSGLSLVFNDNMCGLFFSGQHRCSAQHFRCYLSFLISPSRSYSQLQPVISAALLWSVRVFLSLCRNTSTSQYVETDRGPVSLTFTLYLIVYFKKDKEEKSGNLKLVLP